jgi:hypothetical protein
MPVGDEASAAGYPLVPDTGEEGLVRYGAREINRTRDMVAAVRGSIPAGKTNIRTWAGITTSIKSPLPEEGNNGDIHFKVL